MKWEKERDALIAQTKAFVQSVTGRIPDMAIEPVSIEPFRNKNAVFTAYAADAAAPTALIASVDKIEQPDVFASLDALPVRELPKSDVRHEIQGRVAAFQAHQQRFHRERDDYFNSVLPKARSAIENGLKNLSA